MAKKKAEVAEEQPVEQRAPVSSRFVDVLVDERRVPVRLRDERLLEIADEACQKHRAIADLKAEIKAFADARKDHIKGLAQEAAALDDQFYQKTEMVRLEVRIVKDFAVGRLRVEVVETGEVVEDREMTANEHQREFASMLEADPSDQLLQRAADIVRMQLEQEIDPTEFPAVIAQTLGVSLAFGERMVELLKWKDVLTGEGTESDPFRIEDPDRGCGACRREEVCGTVEECQECQYVTGFPNFEKPEKCDGCKFKRQMCAFEPCASCDPVEDASGFVALDME